MGRKGKSAKERAALHAMAEMKFSKELTSQVLKELLHSHGDDWETIEEGNYSLLDDAICAAQEKARKRVTEMVTSDAIDEVSVPADSESTRGKLLSLLSASEKLLAMENTNSAKDKLVNIKSSNQANLNILIPSPNSTTSSFILGPILESSKDATMTSSMLTKTPLLFNQPWINISSWHIPHNQSLRLWPVSNKLYTEWLDRIEYGMADLWREVGIYGIIQMSRDFSLKPHPYLIGASLCFWSTASNSLHLQYGMVTPTLFDLAAIAGLRPDGCSVNAAMDVDISLFNDDIKECHHYSTFIEKFNAKDGPVKFKEHVAFLWYWICRFLACSPSKKIVHQYLGLAVCLAQRRKLALGQFVLGELYKGISDVILHLNSEDKRYVFANASGPLWIYQIWLYAYFPELVHLNETLLEPSPPNYGSQLLYCSPKWNTLKNEDFVENFSFFYNLKSRPAEYHAPFAKRLFGPSWFRSETLDWSNVAAIWSRFLCSAGLHVGLKFKGRGKCTQPGVLYYFPNCVARQFGLTQGVPILLLYWVFNDYSAPFQSLDDIKQAELLNAMLDEWYSHEAFTTSPCTTKEFDLWWMDYVKSTFQYQISELKCRLLFTSQSQLPMKSLRSCNVGVTNKTKKKASGNCSTQPEDRQPPKKKAKQSSPIPSNAPEKIDSSKGDASKDVVFLTRKELIPHFESSDQRESPNRNHLCLMDPTENPTSSNHNTALDDPDIDLILRSIEVEPDDEGLLAFVNSLAETAIKRASIDSAETSCKIKASFEELLELILAKEFTTVCQETASFERLKELVQFLISQEGHDFIGRDMLSTLHKINQQIKLQLECISACKSIIEITEKQEAREEENANERDLLKVKRLLEDKEMELRAAKERKKELTTLKLEYEEKIRKIDEELDQIATKEDRASSIKIKAEEKAENLAILFNKLRKEKLALDEEKAAAEQVCHDLNLKWVCLGRTLNEYK